MRVLVATKPVDFRKGADGLAAVAKEALGQDPFSGTVIIFRARRADRIKIIVWDGDVTPVSHPAITRVRA